MKYMHVFMYACMKQSRKEKKCIIGRMLQITEIQGHEFGT